MTNELYIGKSVNNKGLGGEKAGMESTACKAM